MSDNGIRSLVDQIVEYEQGELDDEATVELFQSLIDSGQVWRLQGHYGRTAMDLIESGFCTLGPERATDAYGSPIPSRDEVEPGTPGSPEFVAARREAS